MNLRKLSEEIVATTRKLRAEWTYEETLPTWAIEELSKLLVREMMEEIDQEIIRDLRGLPRKAEAPIAFQGDLHGQYIRQLLGMV